MTDKHLRSFFGGMILTGLIYFLIVVLFVFGSFSLSGESLQKKENTEAFVFFAVLTITLITAYIIFRRWRTNRKASAAGIGMIMLFGIYASIMSGIQYVSNLNYHVALDQQTWKNADFKPFNMARTLLKDDQLIGLTKQQLIDKLGIGNLGNRDGNGNLFTYITDTDNWQLKVWIKNDIVTETTMWRPGFE